MKKLIFGVILIIAVSVACLLYLKNNTASGAASIPNIYLTTLNYAVQIGYNILYLIVAFLLYYMLRMINLIKRGKLQLIQATYKYCHHS